MLYAGRCASIAHAERTLLINFQFDGIVWPLLFGVVWSGVYCVRCTCSKTIESQINCVRDWELERKLFVRSCWVAVRSHRIRTTDIVHTSCVQLIWTMDTDSDGDVRCAHEIRLAPASIRQLHYAKRCQSISLCCPSMAKMPLATDPQINTVAASWNVSQPLIGKWKLCLSLILFKFIPIQLFELVRKISMAKTSSSSAVCCDASCHCRKYIRQYYELLIVSLWRA